MRMKLFRITGWLLVGLFALWSAGLLWFASGISAATAQSPEQRAGAIVVLTGGEGRIDEGLALFADGKASYLFITGVNPDVTPREIYALWKGGKPLPECCISLGYLATNTAGNAAETAEWVRETNLTSIRLVTSNYHLTRSLLEFRRAMPGIEIVPHPVTPPLFKAWSGPFWLIALREYNKTILTWLRLSILPRGFMDGA